MADSNDLYKLESQIVLFDVASVRRDIEFKRQRLVDLGWTDPQAWAIDLEVLSHIERAQECMKERKSTTRAISGYATSRRNASPVMASTSPRLTNVSIQGLSDDR